MKKILSALIAIMLLTTLLLPFASAATPGNVNSVSVAADGTRMDVILQIPSNPTNNLYVYLDDNQLTDVSLVPYSQSGLGTSWVIVVDRQFDSDANSKPVTQLIRSLMTNLIGENDNVALVFTDEVISSMGTLEDALKRIDSMPARDIEKKTFYRTIGDAVDYLSTGADVLPRTVKLIFSTGDNNNGEGMILSDAKEKLQNSNITSFAFAVPYGSTTVRSDYPSLAQNGGFDTTRAITEIRDNSEAIIRNTRSAVQQWYTLSIDLSTFTAQTNGQLKIVAGSKEFTCTLSSEQIRLINNTRPSIIVSGTLEIVSRGGFCFVVGSNTPDAASVTIAGTHDGLPLIRIEESAFAINVALKNLTIEEGVQTIGANAFAGCSQLRNVILPKSITSIDDSAFAGVNATFIVREGSYAESFVKRMGFSHNVIRADGEFTSGDYTLSSKDGNVSIISWNNTTASTLTVPAVIENHPVVSIADNAFANNTNLESVSIAEGVQTIGANAFSGCTNLVKVTLPESLTSIDSTAFTNCPGTVLITKADSYAHAFAQNAGIPYGFPGDVVDGSFILYPVDGGLAIRSWNRNDATTVYINAMVNGQRVVSIGEEAFANKAALETVIIEDGVKSIAAYAFSDCTSLKNVTLPASLTSIASSAFSGCTDPELTFSADKDTTAHKFCTDNGYKIKGESIFSSLDWTHYALIGGGALLLILIIVIIVLLLKRRKPIRSQDYDVEGLTPSSIPDVPTFTSPVLSTEVDSTVVRVRVTLTPVNGRQGEHFDHDMTEELVIGRDPGTNGLKLPDREEFLRISRVHMRLFYEDGIMYAQNESRNGTSVNSTRLGETAAVIHERDRITMGRVDFIVTWHRI